MRRLLLNVLSIGTTLSLIACEVGAQQAGVPQSPRRTAVARQTQSAPAAASNRSSMRLQKLSVPHAQARTIATKLSLQYRDVAGVQISPDTRNGQLVVMAPEATQRAIAKDVNAVLASHVTNKSNQQSGPLNVGLTYITWREFEDDLRRLSGGSLPVTTSRNGERAAFQLTASPLQGTTIEVDRRNNSVTVVAPQPMIPGWERMIATLDQTAPKAGTVTELLRLENAEPAPIQRALRLLKELESGGDQTVVATPVGANSPFRNAVFQQNVGGAQPAGDAGQPPAEGETGGAGVIGDTQIQFVPELGTIIIRGAKRDVERVMDVIKQIEEQSEVTKPDVQVVELAHADANAVATLLAQLYEDVLSARQGEVSITSLDTPNALLLIGRTEAIDGLKELIGKIDQPVAESSRLRVFRLQNASAVDAETTIRDFFTDRPGTGDDLRPGVGSRVRVLADYRTNSLVISAAPRDMIEVTRLINDLDVQQISAQNQIKIFPLKNAVAEDLAPIIQSSINGEGEGGNDNVTAPSTSLSIVAIDADDNRVLDSGILAGAVVTAETGANAIVVRAPAASMPLIGELIRQLDRAPGIESLVKVFTIQNGDAAQLTTALTTLFGDDAATTGTSVGAANLPDATASGDSSLVPLRFSTDVRTNSIVASGSEPDLEVVESILLRLDSEGFAERITEVIWLRHANSDDVALAIQSYVQSRTTTVNTIQQYQTGLGPYDLPDRDLIVVSEPTSNTLLLSVSPRMYEDVRRVIDKLDRRRAMILIKVLLAEVRLDDTFEIGGELGLQDSLLYDRGVAAGAFPGATAPSFDINSAGVGAANPGFNFNSAGVTNANSFGQGNVASRGLSSFGLGTTNSALGYGGFVLSAASDSVSLLLRTLQDAQRLQILSRPNIMTVDNSEASIDVGRLIARVTDVINNGVAGTQVVTEDISVGLIVNVLPRIGADGLIIMNIDATRSARDDNNGTFVPTGGVGGDVVFINDILQQTAQSTIAAYSGQTVIFGGLIQKTRTNFSRRVPIVADIPLLGHFFKYDQEAEARSELLMIMTPMIVTGEEDLEYVKQTESSRMSWCLADVVEAHGDVGLSGGYGLWGPAVGNTIYPDMQPTIDDIIIEDAYPAGGPIGGSGVIEDGLMIDQSPSVQGGSVQGVNRSPAVPSAAIQAPASPIQIESSGIGQGQVPGGGMINSPPSIPADLPAPVSIPQSSVSRTPQYGSVAQSSFPLPATSGSYRTSMAAATQAGWLNTLSASNETPSAAQSDRQTETSPQIGARPKPTRLGSVPSAQ